ncbi:MAG: sulfite exporter TauE/SafE family protein [Smithellaceae bacterium]|nr:sulfite exporter TauE/SafE family protein [Smithellaceae bacterium]
MVYPAIILVSMGVAALTLFSGFGLGTVLMPVFAIFFPVHLAIAATAVVHLANNIFKVLLVGKKADLALVARFGLPAALSALAGAYLLTVIAQGEPLITYSLAGVVCRITLVKLVVALLLLIFALWEVIPYLAELAFPRRFIPLGGVLSGFFGGLTGNQGALRSAFLIRSGLDKEAFVGTSAVAAMLVDVVRLAVYGASFLVGDYEALADSGIGGPIMAGVLAAFVGSFFGARLLKKVTLRAVQLLVSVMLFSLALLLALGVI